MLGKHKSVLTNEIILKFKIWTYVIYLINFWDSFASHAPADSSLALFMVEIIEPRHLATEKHKNILKNSTC